jgi:hypothetical protein
MSEYTDDYAYWRNALAGVAMPIHDSDPQPGFYRKRVSRGGAFVPVAIWEHEGQMVAVVDGKPTDAAEIWSYCCQHPVTEEAFRARTDGGAWPDEDKAVTQSLATPGIGDNRPPQDEADILAAQIEAASANAAEYAEIRDDETAARAQSVRSRLLELSGEADKKRDKLVRPHLDAQKSINGLWQPLVKSAKEMADKIKLAISAHENRKLQAEQKARAEALAQARAAEEAARKAAEAGKPIPAPATPPEPVPPPPAPAAQVRGAYGRAAAVKLVKVCTVTDFDAAYGSLKANLELKALISKLAQKAVDAGYEVAGTTVEEQRRVS